MDFLKYFVSRFARPVAAILAAVALSGCEIPAGGGFTTGFSSGVDRSKPVTVALLVPLGSGQASQDKLATSLVNAARMATGDLQGVNIDLRIYATAGDAGQAIVAAQRAIDEGADIFVGPLFSGATSAVAPIAGKKGLTVLSLSNNPVVAGGNVYVMGQTFDDTATRLVGFAGANGLRNIGIVYPDSIEGQAGRDAVVGAASRQGVSIAGTASYPLTIRGIGQAMEPIAQQMRSAGADAIFLTDNPTGGLGFVAIGLRSSGLGSGATQFIGLSRWDASADILTQPSLRDGWFALPDPDLTARFEERYLTTYGTDAHELSGLAYDAVAAIGAMLREAPANDSRPFARARLTNPSGFAGVNGVFRFKADNTVQRGLAVMSVGRGTADVISPAPRNFSSAGL